jgi:hypothetical protein
VCSSDLADNIAGVSNYQHGYMMWKSDNELNAIKARNTGTAAREPYITNYKMARSTGGYGGTCQDGSNSTYHKGYRWPGGDRTSAIHNAIMAMIEGFTARINSNPPFVEYAKRFLMDNELNMDPTGYELTEGGSIPKPSIEIYDGLGYYAKSSVYSYALAYDMLITRYRAPAYPNGFTAIEDLRMRDVLARTAVEALMEMGTYSAFTSQGLGNGMTGQSAEFAALVVALAMPSYSTPYFGTAGFNGNTQTYPFTPYPDHPVTWKAALYDNNTPLYSFPNQVYKFGMDEAITTQPVTRTDGRVCPAGSFNNRPGYYGILLMGHMFHVLANVMKIRLNYDYVNLEKSFDYSNKGTMYSLQINGSGDDLPYHYPQVMLVNEHFPAIAQGAWDYLSSQNSGTNGFGNQLYYTDPYGMVWLHDDWKDHLAAVNDKPAAKNAQKSYYCHNTETGIISLGFPASSLSGGFKVYNCRGATVAALPVRNDDITVKYSTGLLTNGIYYYELKKGAENISGTFVVSR